MARVFEPPRLVSVLEWGLGVSCIERGYTDVPVALLVASTLVVVVVGVVAAVPMGFDGWGDVGMSGGMVVVVVGRKAVTWQPKRLDLE